jgi:hypothetical protein
VRFWKSSYAGPDSKHAAGQGLGRRIRCVILDGNDIKDVEILATEYDAGNSPDGDGDAADASTVRRILADLTITDLRQPEKTLGVDGAAIRAIWCR